MAYPRLLRLDADTEARLKSYLDMELLNHYAERQPWMDRLLRFQRDYWAEPTTKQATFPFTGAATLVIPLTAIAVEAVHARVMTQAFSIGQLVSATAKSSEWAEAARPLENYMNQELIYGLNIKKNIEPSILEIEKFGTGIAKVGYTNIVKKAIRTQPNGDETEVPITMRRGPCVDYVSAGRFLMPFSAQDPQTAPWCGEEHSRSPYEVLTLEQSGMFYPGTMQALQNWVGEMSLNTTGVEREFMRSQEQLEKRVAVWPKLLDWNELWCSFDVDGDGINEEICIHYHRGARYIMAARYNWHTDLRRPYRHGNYFPVEGRWQGVGIAKQNEQFQKEVTTQHRQRIDNATLANMRMIKISKLSGYRPGEPIFPGKMWFVDDMSHVDTLQMGEIYNSAYSNEQAVVIYSQQRTGVNDATLGQPQAGTPGTATAELARIQEGTKKFDYAFSNIKTFLRDIVVDTACCIQQFGPRHVDYYELAEGGQMVKAFFTMPEEQIRDGVLIELVSAGQQQNKILDRQNWISVATLLQQYYTGAMQLSMNNPQIMQYISQTGLGAITEAMRQILESFDIRNVDRIILSQFLQGGPQSGNQAIYPAAPDGGAAGGPAGPNSPQAMELLAKLIQGARGSNGARV